MDYKKLLGKQFENWLARSKSMLQEHGRLDPYILLLADTPEQPRVAWPVELDTLDQEPDFIVEYTEERLRATKAWGYVIVTEAWVLHGADFPGGEVPANAIPDQHPKKRTAVWVEMYTRDYHFGKAVIFERQDQRIVFTDQEITLGPDENFGARFTKLLAPLES